MFEDISVSNLPGVGQAKQKCLAALNIMTVGDLLHYYPMRYEDHRVRPIDGLQEPTQVTVEGVVEGIASVRWSGRRSITKAKVRVDLRHVVTVIWFHQHFLKAKLTDGRRLVITGRFDPSKRTLVASRTDFQLHRQDAAYVPVYPVVKGLSSNQIAQLIDKAFELYAETLVERLPSRLSRKYRLISHREAVGFMHHPATEEQRHQAHRRLAFEEFFLFQIQLQMFRSQHSQRIVRNQLDIPDASFPCFQAGLPFTLTDAQRSACEEMTHDLSLGRPMMRLLQGDVGSGKTLVALWAAFAVCEAGGQTAMMAPTEILAEQLYDEAQLRLTPHGSRVALLTGRTKPQEREVVLERVRSGEVQLLVGTHALLTEDVYFRKLDLAVIDEQHRFGVEQRNQLVAKGNHVHVLMMSATPIPRSLALAVYGDLDLSTLAERPAGRKPIRTWRSKMNQEPKVIRYVRQALAKGEQAYIVAPAIDAQDDEEDADVTGLTTVTELSERLMNEFAGFRTAVLHGKLAALERESVMRAFVSGDIQVLISTTVIEVGINVPNATVMVIYQAERFGLAQLHQLRGRVGRGVRNSVCFLLSDATSELAEKRLQTIVESQDGFWIADKDLELRGPGEFLGLRQSGLPEFTVGDLSTDLRIMEVAREEAVKALGDKDFWLMPEYEGLRSYIQQAEPFSSTDSRG